MEIITGERITELDEKVLKPKPDKSNLTLFSGNVFRANPYTSVVGIEVAEIVGHMFMLPITDEAYYLLRDGKYVLEERDLGKDITSLNSDVKECRLFIVNAYLHPDHRTPVNVRKIARATIGLFDNIKNMGVRIKSIMSNAHNDRGVRISTYVGLKYSHDLPDGTKIMEVVFDQ